METAGYSGTSLARKLGLKDGQAVGFLGLLEGLTYLAQAAAFRRIERAADWRGWRAGGSMR